MQQACGAGAEIARVTGASVPTSTRVSSNLAVRRCIDDQRNSGTKDKLDKGSGARLAVTTSGLAVNLGPPPAYSDKQEPQIMKEFWLFALEGMADELERPSHEEEGKRIGPEAVDKEAGDQQGERNKNCRYTQGVADAVDGVLMTGRILRDPLFVGAGAQHGESMIQASSR